MSTIAHPARRLFGTDGIRGVANEPPMTPEIAFQVGAAITYLARPRHRDNAPTIVIGKDTRLSGYLLETALTSGVCAMGGRALLCGPIPTPAVAHLTTSMRADAGIVISASHNPYQDNGIKIFGADGFKLADELESKIEDLFDSPELLKARATGDHVGRAGRDESVSGRYVTFVKATFPRELTLEGMKIVVDAAHGAAYKVAPWVFSELGAEVISLGVNPNGRNINDGCGALHPENLAAVVRQQSAHLGIALDGDADRLIVVDELGNVVDGDAIMGLCATRMMAAGTLRGSTVVATVMTNLGLQQALERVGVSLLRTNVGDRYVVEAMRSGGFSFGGEQSGHLVFLDHATTGDGLIAALQVLAIMVREQRPLSVLSGNVMTRVPQVLEAVTLKSRRPIDQMLTLSAEITSLSALLGSTGRILVRWSGTEAKLRVMVEGTDLHAISKMAQTLCNAARLDG